MTYTQIALLAIAAVAVLDIAIARTRLLGRRLFWVSYAIILFFQLITNAMFTGWGIVRYSGDAIIGSDSPAQGPPPFLGDGRIAFAPAEDLLFGFALILLTLVCWTWLGRRGVQRTPMSGPPRWRRSAVNGAGNGPGSETTPRSPGAQ